VDIKTILKSSVAAGALVALAAPMQMAEAGSIAAGNSKIDLKVGGRVIRGVQYIDDGNNTNLFHTHGRSADTEIYFAVSGKLTESTTAGAVHRFDVNEVGNSSFSAAPGQNDTQAAAADAQKFSYVYFKHKSMGTLTMGFQGEAGDGAVNLKYGKALVGSPGLYTGNTTLTTGTAGTSTVTAGAQASNLDPGSSNEIRYDSPSISGFTLSGSQHSDGGFSTAVRYSGKIAGLSVKGAYHYNGESGGNDGSNYWGGSIAVQHSSGFHVAIADSHRRGEGLGRTPDYRRYSGGYEASMNSLGKTDFYVQYMKGEDIATAGTDGTEIVVGVTQGLDAIGGAIGLAYANVSVDDAAGTAYNDVDVVYLETQINF
jgi:hypothetical protein